MDDKTIYHMTDLKAVDAVNSVEEKDIISTEQERNLWILLRDCTVETDHMGQIVIYTGVYTPKE